MWDKLNGLTVMTLWGCLMLVACGGDKVEKLAAVKIDGLWGYINAKGTLVIKPQFDDAGPFSEGLAAVEITRQWGYINAEGTLVIKPQFDDVRSFSEGLAAVEIIRQWGIHQRRRNPRHKTTIRPRWELFGGVGCGGNHQTVGIY